MRRALAALSLAVAASLATPAIATAQTGDTVVLDVRLAPVRLFDEVVVRGETTPAHAYVQIEVVLIRSGRPTASRTVTTGAAGGFSATFRILDPGAYRARATVRTTGLEGTAVSDRDVTPLPRLSSGSHGVYVELLERRLVELDYRLAAPTDGRYDFRTADAVVAFHKVQRMPRSYSVDARTWRALADPRRPHPRRDWRGLHIEVDQTRQVLYTVENGEVTNVLHVSTGAGGATHDGAFRVFRKIAGYSGGRLYYPSYFDGLRALHGWPEVPTYPASHGCVRIPYWNAQWVFGMATFGTRVVIYH
jgi:lipoprotein-anchoring transpeptidase ErfK/SrfK